MLRPAVSASIGKMLRLALFFSALLPGLLRAADECACLPCDFDQDGDVDMADFGHLQACLTGYGIPQTDPTCFDARIAGHTYVDQQDLIVFRACLGGEQLHYPGTNLPPAIISEFVASNDGGLTDKDGDHSDWIEIYVPCVPTMDLTGCFLANSPDNLKQWAFPATILHRGDYLIVFASGKDRSTSGQELHTNFQLNKDGEFLALVAPDGQTIIHSYAPNFPAQLTNVSYGMAQGSITSVAKGGSAWYHVPAAPDAALGTAWTLPDFADDSWSTGPSGLGFSSAPTVFSTTVYKANVAVPNLAAAEAVISDPTKRAWTATAQVPTVNFLNTGDPGNYTGDQSFPGMNLGTDVDQFVTLITATVVIPVADEWTFGVNSDEGFGLTLTQGSNVFSMNFPDIRTASDTLHVFKVTSPGIYSLRLVHFDQTGGASLELFAAQGSYEAFDPAVFHLVGDIANGGLTLGGLGADVLTNLAPAMKGVNSSVWLRLPFDLADPTFYTGVKLRIRYVDGFAAYLNGEEVCRRNTPTDIAWNSAAPAPRTGQQAATTEEITLAGANDLLRAGRNVLAIHGLNDTAADGDFAIVPELILSSNSMQPQYFPTPTPGAPNGPGVQDFVRPVAFDQPHGFRNAPFQLTITCPTPASEIRYTLDGSTPTATTGTTYAGPLAISATSVVRAAAFKTGWLPSPVMTQTYLFISDVILQQPQGQAPGPAWPAPGSVNGQVINYGMDPDIVNSSTYSSLMDDALLAIPSVSLVTDLPNLFSSSTGIYTHAANDGQDWERPCSVELLNPDGSAGFTIGAGVRIRGGYSRTGSNPKHGLRLFFRAQYGDKELDYPIFGNEGVSSFRKVDLRTDQNYSWSFGGDPRNTMTRDLFVRDIQGAMGDPYTRSRSVHLYIDGVYWGIYHFQERAEADYAASYFGGTDNDYDVVKVDAGPYTIYATDGTTDAWYRLWQACNAGFSSDAAYMQVQGLNPDGTRNPAYEVLVDVDNTIDCALDTYWSGDLDGPISAFLGNGSPNNFYVIHNHDGQSGFKCFKHDCEHTLLNVSEDRTGPFSAGQGFAQFNPQYLSQCLAANAEYKVRFGDRVQKHLFNLGPLTAANAAARFQAWANHLDMAIIAESARWGDAQRNPPLTRADWLNEISWVVNTCIPARNAYVISQLQADGLYPSVAAPLFANYGGQVQPGYALGLSKPSGQAGTIYYTIDGSDPRLRGGAVSGSAQIYNDTSTNTTLIAKAATWRYYNAAHLPDMTWITRDYPETNWLTGPAELGWGDGGEATLFPSTPTTIRDHTTYYFRKSFTLPAGNVCTALTANLRRDDGGAVYLNGNTPVASNMPATWTATTAASSCVSGSGETTYYPLTLNSAQLASGNNVLAVEIHQCSGDHNDLSFDLELIAALQSTPVVIDHNMVVKARIYNGGQWSALVEAVFVTQPANLVINEFMADNATTIQNPDKAGEYPDWFEIYNPNPIAMDMGGMYLTDDLGSPTKFRINNGVSIPANGRLVFWADNHSSLGNLHTNFALSKGGEQIGLYATDGVTLIDGLTFGAQTTDVSFGRYPDGGSTWGFLQTPTPGQANSPLR